MSSYENAVLVYEGLDESRIPVGIICYSLAADIATRSPGIWALSGVFLSDSYQVLSYEELIHLVLVYSEIITTNLRLPQALAVRYYLPTDEGVNLPNRPGRLAFMVEFSTGVYLNDQERKN